MKFFDKILRWLGYLADGVALLIEIIPFIATYIAGLVAGGASRGFDAGRKRRQK